MNKLIMVLIFLTSQSLQAGFNFSTEWVDFNTKHLKITCSGEESYICHYICMNEESCSIEEGICRNCIGNGLFLTHFFKNVGHQIQAVEHEMPRSTVYLPFLENNYITLTANSIYNIVTDLNSKKMQKQFKKLCPFKTEQPPIVFASVDELRVPNGFSFVACDNKFYELTDTPELYHTPDLQ